MMKKSLLVGLIALSAIGVRSSEVPLFRISGLTFDFHKTWSLSAGKSSMTKASMTYLIDGKPTGPSADFLHFGQGQGGGVQANLDRWKKQFQGSPTTKEETRKVGERSWHFVRIDGTFLKGRPFGPKAPVADQRMLGAIVEDAGGTVFVKLVDGQAAVSEAVEKAFIKLIESAL